MILSVRKEKFDIFVEVHQHNDVSSVVKIQGERVEVNQPVNKSDSGNHLDFDGHEFKMPSGSQTPLNRGRLSEKLRLFKMKGYGSETKLKPKQPTLDSKLSILKTKNKVSLLCTMNRKL